MSGLFIGDSPVDGRNLPAQWHRAVATISINGESPAYSHGGDQSAGFYGGKEKTLRAHLKQPTGVAVG